MCKDDVRGLHTINRLVHEIPLRRVRGMRPACDKVDASRTRAELAVEAHEVLCSRARSPCRYILKYALKLIKCDGEN